MKGKKVIAGILLVGIIGASLAGCKNTNTTKKEREKPVITLGSDSYPPYNYLNEDGIPTGIDVELATEAFMPPVSIYSPHILYFNPIRNNGLSSRLRFLRYAIFSFYIGINVSL